MSANGARNLDGSLKGFGRLPPDAVNAWTRGGHQHLCGGLCGGDPGPTADCRDRQLWQ
jgi:hypothetical protein